MAKVDRIAVIGAGVVGGSVAYYLSEFGANVTVFDRSSAGSGASSHSFAWLNAFGKSPRHYFDLNHRSMELWSRFVDKLGQDVGLNCEDTYELSVNLSNFYNSPPDNLKNLIFDYDLLVKNYQLPSYCRKLT
mgnify:CR=1 FL=1